MAESVAPSSHCRCGRWPQLPLLPRRRKTNVVYRFVDVVATTALLQIRTIILSKRRRNIVTFRQPQLLPRRRHPRDPTPSSVRTIVLVLLLWTMTMQQQQHEWCWPHFGHGPVDPRQNIRPCRGSKALQHCGPPNRQSTPRQLVETANINGRPTPRRLPRFLSTTTSSRRRNW